MRTKSVMMVSLTTRVDIGTGSVCGMEVDSYERDFVERRNMGELRTKNAD